MIANRRLYINLALLYHLFFKTTKAMLNLLLIHIQVSVVWKATSNILTPTLKVALIYFCLLSLKPFITPTKHPPPLVIQEQSPPAYCVVSIDRWPNGVIALILMCLKRVNEAKAIFISCEKLDFCVACRQY